MDFAPDAAFPGPDDAVYTIRIYRPCDYCETPLGVDIQRVDPEGQELWSTDGLPMLDFETLDLGLKAALINVLDIDKLKERLKTTLVDEVEADLLDVILDDFIREEFHKAVGTVKVTK
jgi:hypothetical protein